MNLEIQKLKQRKKALDEMSETLGSQIQNLEAVPGPSQQMQSPMKNKKNKEAKPKKIMKYSNKIDVTSLVNGPLPLAVGGPGVGGGAMAVVENTRNDLQQPPQFPIFPASDVSHSLIEILQDTYCPYCSRPNS